MKEQQCCFARDQYYKIDSAFKNTKILLNELNNNSIWITTGLIIRGNGIILMFLGQISFIGSDPKLTKCTCNCQLSLSLNKSVQFQPYFYKTEGLISNGHTIRKWPTWVDYRS